MKTIPVVRRIQDEATILKNNPILIRVAAEIDNRDAKKHDDKRRAPGDSEKAKKSSLRTDCSRELPVALSYCFHQTGVLQGDFEPRQMHRVCGDQSRLKRCRRSRH